MRTRKNRFRPGESLKGRENRVPLAGADFNPDSSPQA